MFNRKFNSAFDYLNDLPEQWSTIDCSQEHPLQVLFDADAKKFNSLTEKKNESGIAFVKHQERTSIIKVDCDDGLPYWMLQRLYLSTLGLQSKTCIL